MANYEKPNYTPSQIDRAGHVLNKENSTERETIEALAALGNWRSAHSLPLNNFYVTLSRRATKIDAESIAAQRLKRFESIVSKLSRQPSMKMSRMQDIGGCRAVVSSIAHLDALRSSYDNRPLAHELTNQRDYVAQPKSSGYRSIHLMYRFAASTQSQAWNKLRIEIQMRTKLQHAWATAVETAGTFLSQNLKASEGSSDWMRFFALMGTVHALQEGCAPVPDTPSLIEELLAELKMLDARLDVVDTLESYAGIVQHLAKTSNTGSDKWYLLELNVRAREVNITDFARSESKKARLEYDRLEQRNDTDKQVVLVSSSSLSELPRAYPNYFADTRYFTATVKQALTGIGFDLKELQTDLAS